MISYCYKVVHRSQLALVEFVAVRRLELTKPSEFMGILTCPINLMCHGLGSFTQAGHGVG